MSLFRRGEIWYASYSLPGGKRIKESLGASDKRLANELHDKRKAELWRVERLGDFPDVKFDDACMRWLEEKAEKKSLKDDRGRMAFWLAHFEGVRLKDITEQKIYSAVSRMSNRKQLEIWKSKAAAQRNGLPTPEYQATQVTTSTKAKRLALMKAILRAAEREWKWLEKAPVIKIPQVRNKRVRWLYGSEHVLKAPLHISTFLSCLYGSERAGVNLRITGYFLSCLYGSEQKQNERTPNG